MLKVSKHKNKPNYQEFFYRLAQQHFLTQRNSSHLSMFRFFKHTISDLSHVTSKLGLKRQLGVKSSFNPHVLKTRGIKYIKGARLTFKEACKGWYFGVK